MKSPSAEPSAPQPISDDRPGDDRLVRRIGLLQATALNMIDMIGVGPFITLPLIVAAMHGPQAMLGWVLGAILVMCDGLVWAELGAMMPEAGGPVRYLRAMYGPRVGRFLAFLFVWQLTFSAPLSMASGCIGFAQYAAYLWPALGHTLVSREAAITLPGLGRPPSSSRSRTGPSWPWVRPSRRSSCCIDVSRSWDGLRGSSGSA